MLRKKQTEDDAIADADDMPTSSSRLSLEKAATTGTVNDQKNVLIVNYSDKSEL